MLCGAHVACVHLTRVSQSGVHLEGAEEDTHTHTHTHTHMHAHTHTHTHPFPFFHVMIDPDVCRIGLFARDYAGVMVGMVLT